MEPIEKCACSWTRRKTRQNVCLNCCNCNTERCTICREVHSSYFKTKKKFRSAQCECRVCSFSPQSARKRLDFDDHKTVTNKIISGIMGDVLTRVSLSQTQSQCWQCEGTNHGNIKSLCTACCYCRRGASIRNACDICAETHRRFMKREKGQRLLEGFGCTPYASVSTLSFGDTSLDKLRSRILLYIRNIEKTDQARFHVKRSRKNLKGLCIDEWRCSYNRGIIFTRMVGSISTSALSEITSPQTQFCKLFTGVTIGTDLNDAQIKWARDCKQGTVCLGNDSVWGELVDQTYIVL